MSILAHPTQLNTKSGRPYFLKKPQTTTKPSVTFCIPSGIPIFWYATLLQPNEMIYEKKKKKKEKIAIN